MTRTAFHSLSLVALVALAGCLGNSRRGQLDRVAKDWCETIRAAQVIPIFPLREDLQPGDVFLVRRPLAQQRKDFQEGGPLALDDQRTRLGRATTQPTTNPAIDYSLMYFDGYFRDTFGSVPHERVVRGPGDATVFIERMPVPAATFPAYSFEVKSGSSANLAIPISGVPVALGFMQTGNATGTVHLRDAYTYAADAGEIYRFISRWAEDGENRLALNDAVHNNGGRPVHLRVVTRVFLVGGVAVSLVNQETGGVRGSAGEIPAIPIFDTASGSLNENYAKVLDLLGKQASGTPSTQPTTQPLPAPAAQESTPATMPTQPPAPLVGGNVKFTWANRRNVSMDERFARPLVVGYHAFDVPVYDGGVLGYPLATWAVLKGQVAPPSMPMHMLSPAQQQMNANLDWLTNREVDGATIRRTMKQIIHSLRQPAHFDPALKAIDASAAAPDDDRAFDKAVDEFERAAVAYSAEDLTYSVRPRAFNAAFVNAVSARTQR